MRCRTDRTIRSGLVSRFLIRDMFQLRCSREIVSAIDHRREETIYLEPTTPRVRRSERRTAAESMLVPVVAVLELRTSVTKLRTSVQ